MLHAYSENRLLENSKWLFLSIPLSGQVFLLSSQVDAVGKVRSCCWQRDSGQAFPPPESSSVLHIDLLFIVVFLLSSITSHLEEGDPPLPLP